MTSPEARQLKRDLKVAQRARQAKHNSGDHLFVDEVGGLAKKLAEQQDVDASTVNGSECERCGAGPGQPCKDWC